MRSCLEGNEIRQRGARAAVALGLDALAALFGDHAVHHQARPTVARDALKEEQESVADVVEVAAVGVIIRVLMRKEREQHDAEHRIDEDDQSEERDHVDERREGKDHRHDQVLQPLRPAH